MNENENISEEMQEVAEPVVSEEMVEVAEQPQQAEQEVEKEVAKETQIASEKPITTEQDRAFATMRRELERVESENQKFLETMKKFGFNGTTSEDILDEANAHFYGKTVEEVRNERIANERARLEKETMLEKLQRYEMKEIEERMANDLAGIQKINPEIKNLDQLGQPYFELIQKGIDGVKAYKVLAADGLFENQNVRIEQETIKKLKANAQSSVGALDSGVSTPKSVADMNDEEFEAFRQKALRGELRRI